jgi:predicted adenylyl cyclase CyaB
VRVRLEGERAYLTYKGFISDGEAKVREEIETEVGDYQAAREIMRRLGFEEWLEIRKYRWSYSVGRAHVVLDRFEGAHAGIPELLEIEAESIEELRRTAELLGYTRDHLKAWTGTQVFEYYRKKGVPRP